MMSKAQAEKSRQLGMPHGTASNRLRKQLLFSIAKKAGLTDCYQCGEPIKHVGDMSIEHKTPWLHSDDPVGLFFDEDNIAFSHLSCNSAAGRKPQKKPIVHGTGNAYNYRGCRCTECRDWKSTENRKRYV